MIFFLLRRAGMFKKRRIYACNVDGIFSSFSFSLLLSATCLKDAAF